MSSTSVSSTSAASVASAPSTAWTERTAPDEAARFEDYARKLRDMQKRAALKNGGKTDRALHAKMSLGVLADFEVLPNLPDPARQGLFAQPATYPAYVRFSNGAGRRQADGKPDVRGVAIKVVGVKGKKVIPGMEDAVTQDFLMIRTPATPFKGPDDFVPIVLATESPALLPLKVIGQFGLGAGLRLLRALLGGLSQPMTPLASTTYFSATPIQWGAYAAHVSITPSVPGPTALAKGVSADSLGEALTAKLREGAVAYDVRVQLFVDETKTPIEDASVEWKEADAPWITVGRLTLRKQDATSAEGKKITERTDGFSFDPWHALVEHKPLGAMMRARNYAYRLSTEERKASKEPDGTER